MIHILFILLKALGILLLVLLLLVLLAICTVLFLPLCYQARLQKEEEGFACVKVRGRVSWLFGAVALIASYEEQKPEVQIRIFGASPETWKRRLKKIRRGEVSAGQEEKSDTEKTLEAEKAMEKESEQKTDAENKPARPVSEKPSAETQKTPDRSEEKQSETIEQKPEEQPESEQEPAVPKKSVLERFFAIVEHLTEKLLNIAARLLRVVFRLLEFPFRFFEKLGQKIQAGKRLKKKCEKLKKFFQSRMFREALLHVKKELFYFLKKVAPKKVTGAVTFGFDDPALTGETLGILGMVYGKLPKDLSIQPDFENEILRGDVQMKGSFQAVTAAGIALRLFRDQNFRKTIRHFKHKEA